MANGAENRVSRIRQFNRFYTNFIGLVNKTILESKYSLAEVRVMLEINKARACTASQLIRILQIDPGYLSRMLRRFKNEGLVAVCDSAQDKRSQLLKLTEKGETVFNGLSQASSNQLLEIVKPLSDYEQEELVRCMEKIQMLLSREHAAPITIRSYQPGDAGYIAYRHSVLYAKEYGLEPIFEKYVFDGLLSFLNHPASGKMWVAEAYGQIVGFVAIVKADEKTAQLRWFLIEPEFRGKGLGRCLMTEAIAYCREQNIAHVFLWTFAELDAARHLYSSFGFVRTEEEQNDIWKSGLVEEKWELAL